MKFKYVSTFKVTGHGEFPFDMLRYDRCFPASEAQDSYKLRTPETAIDYGEERSVVLRRYTEGNGKNFGDNPTNARWASFGWSVSEVVFHKLT